MIALTILMMAVHPVEGAGPMNPCPGFDYPAVMSVYDPQLDSHLPDSQNINCDDDCTTVATGPLEDWMYEVAGACPVGYYHATIVFPNIGHRLRCVDGGPAIRAAWSNHHNQCVVYFDTLWHLDRKENKITGAPWWAMWMVPRWYVEKWG